MAGRRAPLLIVLLVLAGSVVSAEEGVHVLQRGETIYTLARRYRVDAETLMRFNEIADPTRLPVGARIRIPGTYVVQDGEYPFLIARRLGVNWLELLEVNGLGRDDIVRPGDVLVLPGGASTPIAGHTTPSPARTDPDRESGAEVDATDTQPPAPPEPEPSPRPAPASPAAAQTDPIWPHPGERETWQGKFPGTVMRGSVGDEFVSVAPGVVEFVGPYGSFGKLILVRSANGYLYGYAGADRVQVTAGTRVERGTILGTVGFSPAFNSAMVLFTVWRNNRYVDPERAPRG